MPFIQFRFGLLCILALLQVVVGRAQEYQVESIRIKSGLPSDNVGQIIRSENGFLYVATRRGICKYDGYHFYKNQYAAGNVGSIAIGKNNVVFYNDLSKGLYSFRDIADMPTVIASNVFTDPDPNNDHYEDLFVDKSNRIWCADFNQVKYFTADGADSGAYIINPNGKEIRKTTFVELTGDRLLIATYNGVFLWSGQNKQLQPYPDSALQKLKVSAAAKLGPNNILLSSYEGDLILYNQTSKRLVDKFKYEHRTTKKLLGLVSLDLKSCLMYTTDAVYKWSLNNSEPTLLFQADGATINHVFYDDLTSLIWVSSNRGVFKLHKKQDIVSIAQIPEQLNVKEIAKVIIEAPDNAIWLAAGNKILQYAQTGKWSEFQLPEKTTVNNIVFNRKQLLACSNDGVFYFNGVGFTKLELTGDFKQVKKLTVDKQGVFWLLFNNNEVRTATLINNSAEIPFVLNEPPFWTQNKWNDIICDELDNIWLAGWIPPGYGIARYDKQQSRFIEASSFPENSNHDIFVGDYFNRVAKGQNKALLFSAFGGVNIIDSLGKVNFRIGAKEYNLVSDIVEGISQTADGKVWFCTAEGLNVWNPKTDNVLHISQMNGLPTDELLNGFSQLSDNRLVCAYERGIFFLDQQKILASNFTNKLALSVLEVNGKPVSFNSNVFVFTPKENNIKLYFSSLSFTDKDKLVYRYKLDEKDDWSYLTDAPELTLSHMAPGSYNMTVQVGNSMGEWQQKKLSLHLIIQPPFYQTYWFRFLVASAIAICVFVIYRYRLSQQRASEQMKRRLKDAQLQALRTQMNPHFIFNSLNSINSFILDKRTDEASEYLTTFSRLMRITLELTRKDTVRLSQELEALRLYLEIESTRLEQGFDYSIQVHQDVDVDGINIPPLILQPFVENAIWHGLRNKNTAGYITVKLDMKNEAMLHVQIEDDGVGRKKSAGLKRNLKDHKSYGMEITLNRLQLQHPDNTLIIEDKETDGISEGTLVHLYIHI